MIPIKCQVCPNYYPIGGVWKCQSCGCELKHNEKLRKQIYKVLESFGDDNG